MGQERRRSPRVTPAAGEIRVRIRDQWQCASLVDMSTSGLRFGGCDLPSLGERVAIQLRVPAHLFKLSGAVVRRANDAAVELDPLTPCQKVALNAAIFEAAPPAPTRGAVLLMVDDPVQQIAIGKALRDRGFEVFSRTTPLDVVQKIVDGGTAFRTAIVSAHLPNRAGQDVLEYLANEKPWVRRGVVVHARERIAPLDVEADFVLVDPKCPIEVGRLVDDLRVASS